MTRPTPLSELFGSVPHLRETEAVPTVELAIEGRGRLLSITDVQALLFHTRTERWIKRNVIPEKRILVGHMWCWWESDIRLWLDAQRGAPSNMRRQHLSQRGRSPRPVTPESLRRASEARRRNGHAPSATAASAGARHVVNE